jgi:hypothetical protein
VLSLFHWSPTRAIPSILRWGILARPELEDRGISFVPHGFGSFDKERALSKYVATSLIPKAGMMNAWSDNPVVWELDPEALTAAGTLFIEGNSASANIFLDHVLASTGAAAYERALNSYDAPGAQPEILIPARVPRAAILRIHVTSADQASAVSSAFAEINAPVSWGVCSDAGCPVTRRR